MKSIITKIFIISYFVLFALSESIAQDLTSGLVSVWEFDETSGTTAYDGAGGKNGIVAGDPMNNNGKLDKAYYFSDNTDYVSFPSSPYNFDILNEDDSYAFWIKGTDPTPISENTYILYKWKGQTGYSYCIMTYVRRVISQRFTL